MPPSATHISLGSDDELIEIQLGQFNQPSSAPRPLVFPQPGTPTQQTAPRPPGPPSQQNNAVIDLTEEPDSPVQVRQTPRSSQDAPTQLPSLHTYRHPRRTNSQRMTPPRLARSESIMLTSQTSFIDLTSDDDINTTASTLNNELPTNIDDGLYRPWHHTNQRPSAQPHSQHSLNAYDRFVDMQLWNQAGHSNLASSLARGFGRTLANFLGEDLIGRHYNNISMIQQLPREDRPYPFGSGGAPLRRPPPRPPSPRREVVSLPPTRAGFTRATCVEPNKDGSDGDESIVICPACDEELAYDPADSTAHPPPSGSRKRKRRAGDHHFWAIKKCGHVYCADCFENRRPTKTLPNGVGFRAPPGKLPNQVPQDLRCAVDDCESKVANKTEWVGIFL